MNKNLIKKIGEKCAYLNDGEHLIQLDYSFEYSVLIGSIDNKNEDEDLCSSGLTKFFE